VTRRPTRLSRALIGLESVAVEQLVDDVLGAVAAERRLDERAAAEP